jgi:hypothetical protein
MKPFGIYTLANDGVFDQLVALLNSVEANISADIPVCVIPYDDRLTQVKREIATRPNVTLFDNPSAIQRWENFAQDIWAAHPQGSQRSSAALVKVRRHAQRRYAAFEGEFEKFVVFDADCLAMKPLDNLVAKLDTYDFVFDDWEHAKAEPVAALKLSLVAEGLQRSPSEIHGLLHCSSFFGSKRDVLNEQNLAELKHKLVEQRETEWINGVAEAFLFSYLTLRGEFSQFNYTLSPDSQERTGNCADADPFVEKDHILYNQQGLKPIHRIHYMNYGAEKFARLAGGEDVGMRYQDIFLHYRFLKHPEQKPQALRTPNLWTQISRSSQQMKKRLVKKIAQ